MKITRDIVVASSVGCSFCLSFQEKETSASHIVTVLLRYPHTISTAIFQLNLG